MILGISGFAGVGKDTAADFLVKNHDFVKVSLSDPMKRICKEVYDFSDEQLWGPSEKRNEPDKRYPRGHAWLEPPEAVESKCVCCGATLTRSSTNVRRESFRAVCCYLTPRYALQLLGTEWARHCYEDTWADYALRVAHSLLLPEADFGYTHKAGLFPRPRSATNSCRGVVIPDVRFKNEMAAIKKAGGKVVRVKRTGFEKPAFNHPSETEQVGVEDEEFDYILNNVSDLHYLELLVGRMVDAFNGRIIPYDSPQENVPPFQRK